jgi:hypothetical protein
MMIDLEIDHLTFALSGLAMGLVEIAIREPWSDISCGRGA